MIENLPKQKIKRRNLRGEALVNKYIDVANDYAADIPLRQIREKYGYKTNVSIYNAVDYVNKLIKKGNK